MSVNRLISTVDLTGLQDLKGSSVGERLLEKAMKSLATRHSLVGTPHSSRSATIGSSFAARLAASKLAAMATAPNPAAANTSVKGSYGFNP
jgi:hypothetical protein